MRNLSPDQVDMLVQVRDRITVDGDTWMQKVISDEDALKFLYNERGKWNAPDHIYGFTARAGDVMDMTTPRDIFERLGLNYEGTKFSRNDSEVVVIRYQTNDAAAQVVPRQSDLFRGSGHGSQGDWDAGSWQITPGQGQDAQPIADRGPVDPMKHGASRLPYENPLVGAGWTHGADGAPELHTGTASRMRDGAEMWAIGQDGVQRLIAVLKKIGVDAESRPILEWMQVT